MLSSLYATREALLLSYAAYAVVALIIAVVAAYLLKRRYVESYRKKMLFFWLFNIAAPLIGIVLTAWIVWYLLSVTYKKQLTEVHYIDMTEIFNEFPKVQRIFGEGSMEQILTGEHVNGSLKMKALVSLTENVRKQDIVLVKQALSDRNDEVRLYSFAIIDKMERNINNRIHQTLQRYRETSDVTEKAKIAKAAALLYWEIIYFELADEELKLFIAKEVDRYASEAVAQMPEDADLNLLLGRCCLMTKEYARAEHYLEAASQDKRAVPYLAELYYTRHEYTRVKGVLSGADWLRSDQLLNPVVVLWEGKEAA